MGKRIAVVGAGAEVGAGAALVAAGAAGAAVGGAEVGAGVGAGAQAVAIIANAINAISDAREMNWDILLLLENFLLPYFEDNFHKD